jgi:iron complex outermembrane receptor protein
MTVSIRRFLCVLLPAVAAALTSAKVAIAQEGNLAKKAEIEEMIVSVRRTEENIQEVPIQVTAFGEEIIQSEGLSSLADVAELTPSLQFDTGFWPSDSRVSIRGLFNRAGRPSAAVLIDGIDAMSEALESSGGSALLNQRILDVERIEVARGPQSALYGRAAFSGAVNYVTRRPPDEFEVTAYGQLAEGDRSELRATVGGPLIPGKLTANLLASHYELEGDYVNPNTGGDLGGGDSDGVGLAFNWTPTADVGVYWNNTYSQDEYAPQAVVLVKANTFRVLRADGTLIADGNPDPLSDPTTGGCPNPPFGGNDSCLWVVTGEVSADASQLDTSPDPRTGNDFDGTDDNTYRSSLIVDWSINDSLAFRSATSYTYADQSINFDSTQTYTIPGPDETFGGDGGNYADAKNAFEFNQYYQEFQLNGDWRENVNWLAGVNGFWEDASDRNTSSFWYRNPAYYLCSPNILVNKAAPCSYADTTAFDKTVERDTKSYSLFGLFGWQFADKWKLTLEGRLIYDKITVSADTADLAGDILNVVPFDPVNSYVYRGSPGFRDSVDDTNLVPRFTLEYFPIDNTMLYGSIAQGIKPPTYNTTDLADPTIARVGKEKLWTYEIGTKNTLFDSELLLNGAVFYNDYSDQQTRVQFPNPGGTIPLAGTVNAGKVKVWGVEIDSSWMPTDRWLLNVSYAYTNGELDDLVLAEVQNTGASLSRSELVKAGNLQGDFSGNDTPGTPNHAATFLTRYSLPLTSDLDGYAQGVATYQGERWADNANLVELKRYWLVNLQIGVEAEKWLISVFVDNVFDDDTIRYAQEFIDQGQGFQGPNIANTTLETFTFPIGYFAYLPPPRVAGIRFSYGTR